MFMDALLKLVFSRVHNQEYWFKYTLGWAMIPTEQLGFKYTDGGASRRILTSTGNDWLPKLIWHGD